MHGPRGLKAGWSTQLADGSTLEVRSIRRVLLHELTILRDGEHIASSPSHPDRMLSSSANTLIVVSIWMLIAGTFAIGGPVTSNVSHLLLFSA